MNPVRIDIEKKIVYRSKREARDQYLKIISELNDDYFTTFGEKLQPDSIPIRELTEADILEIQGRIK